MRVAEVVVMWVWNSHMFVETSKAKLCELSMDGLRLPSFDAKASIALNPHVFEEVSKAQFCVCLTEGLYIPSLEAKA